MVKLTTDSAWTSSDTEFYSCATSTGTDLTAIDSEDENGQSCRKSRDTIKSMMLSGKAPIIEKKLTIKKWTLPIKKF